jgi:hypothetical protein
MIEKNLTLLFCLSLFVVFFTFYPAVSFSNDFLAKEIRAVSQSPKLIRSQAVMKDFLDGESKSVKMAFDRRPPSPHQFC